MGRPLPAGRIRIGLILCLAAVALASYAGLQLAKHYWAYWNLGEEAGRVAVEMVGGQLQEPAAREKIQARARDYDLNFEDKEIQISSQPGAVTIAFHWDASVDLPWYSHPLSFQVNITSSRRR